MQIVQPKELTFFLDTVPFVFLFAKIIPNLNKSVGDVFSDYVGFSFFVIDECWQHYHYLRWKNLKNIEDFRDLEYLHYYLNQILRQKLNTDLYDAICELYYGKYKQKLLDVVSEVRSKKYFQQTIPDKEETTIITLCAFLEQSGKFSCKTGAILGDDEHTKLLAKCFTKGIKTKYKSLKYDREKVFTVIDFLKRNKRQIQEIFPEETIRTVLRNYAELKLFNINLGDLKEDIDQLPVFHPRKIHFAKYNTRLQQKFGKDKDNFCDRIFQLLKTTLHKALFNLIYYKKFLDDDLRFNRLQTKLWKEFEKQYYDLTETFYQKYKYYLSLNDKKYSIDKISEFKTKIKKILFNICKNISCMEE